MPVVDRCDSYDSRIKCVGRDDACRRGEFTYSFRAGGWVWTAFSECKAWLSCPYCGETLPTADMVYQRIHEAIHGEDDE